MYKIVLFTSLLTLAVARYGIQGPAYRSLHGGYSVPAPAYGHDLAQPTPYKYGYDIVGGNGHSGDFKQTREEIADGHGNVQGSYGYIDAHGNQRQVDYVADAHGFRAQVKTNEPGTDNQSPADVQLHANPPHAQLSGYAPRSSYGHALY